MGASYRVGTEVVVPARHSLCSLVGRYDNPVTTRLLAPIDCSDQKDMSSNPRWNRTWEANYKWKTLDRTYFLKILHVKNIFFEKITGF
jgi:hypothetical protein